MIVWLSYLFLFVGSVFCTLVACIGCIWAYDRIRTMMIGMRRARKALRLLKEHVRNGGSLDD